MFIANDHILERAARWQDEGHRLALAVVIRTWGSSPRPLGSLMVIRGDGQIEGSVSGGCVEGAVIDSGMRRIEDGSTERLDFGVANETAWQVGLSCGGEISIFVCPDSAMAAGMLANAADAIATRNPVRINCTISGQGVEATETTGGMMIAGPDIAGVRPNRLDDAGQIFRLEVLAQPRLYIIGAVHISQHLAPMAMAAGFEVTVIDPRTTFANSERFPGVTLISDWPDDALDGMVLDGETALVTLTHDPKIDDAALELALPRPLFHLASLGSKRTHAARCERLKQKGFSDDDCARIHGPAGLDIGAKTPAEIAVSVLGEVIAAYRGPR
ncbi:MAG TPA: hypothetical protein DEQ75_02475 [Alphaproteobacteria bacterium]|nr:hypothetical protein [Alphaproteobacteria bacterium]